MECISSVAESQRIELGGKMQMGLEFVAALPIPPHEVFALWVMSKWSEGGSIRGRLKETEGISDPHVCE